MVFRPSGVQDNFAKGIFFSCIDTTEGEDSMAQAQGVIWRLGDNTIVWLEMLHFFLSTIR